MKRNTIAKRPPRLTLFTIFHIYKAGIIGPVSEIHIVRSSIHLETVTVLEKNAILLNKTCKIRLIRQLKAHTSDRFSSTLMIQDF